MCWPRRKIPTNQHGQATRLWLCHCQAIQIRVFHITWFTFCCCFFGWFATANLYPQIKADIGVNNTQKAIAGGCSVASTVIFRVIVGWLCDRIGTKKTYVALLIASAFPVSGTALVTSPTGYIIASFFIGIVGASFVITQVHTTAMFAGKTVGTANATTTGWGNFGGGIATFVMPLLFNHFVSDYGLSESAAWRVCMVVPGAFYIVLAIIYGLFTDDLPPRPAVITSDDDDVNVTVNASEMSTEKENVGGLSVAAKDYRTWILFLVYAACFGIELTVLRFAVGYFTYSFDLDQALAGLMVLCFSFCNLFARSIGGIIADVVAQFAEKSLIGRVYSLFIVLFFEGIFLILFSIGEIDSIHSLGYTVTMLVCFSLFVQAAEGVTFAIVPFVQPKAIGPVAGIVGAGGNMGAMLYAFVIFTNVPDTIDYIYAWLILGIIVTIVSFMSLCIRFSDKEINAADAKMNTWTEIEVEADKNAQKNYDNNDETNLNASVQLADTAET